MHGIIIVPWLMLLPDRKKKCYSPKCLFHPTIPFLFSERSLFFRMFIFQWIRYSNVFIWFFGWERGHQLSTYATDNWWKMGRSPKMWTTLCRGRGCHASCVSYLFSSFWQHFCLTVSCFVCRNLALSLFKKDMFVRNGYFSPTRPISVTMKKLFS